MTTQGLQPLKVWRTPRAFSLGLLLAGGFAVLMLPAASLTRAVVSQLLWSALAAVAAANALERAHRERSALVGWTMLGGALALMCLATGSTVIEYLTAGQVLPFPRLGDWLQLPAFAIMGFALLAWPLGSPSPTVRLRTFVDAMLFAVALFSVIWALVLWPARRESVPREVWAILVGQFGIMAITFAIIAYLGMGNRARLKGPVGWLCAVLLSALIATLAILAAGSRGSYYVGHWADLLAGVPLFLFTFAASSKHPVTGASEKGTHAPDPLLFGGWLTYGSVTVAFAVSLWAMMFEQREDPVLIGHGFAVIGLLVLRQLLAVRDIRRLTGSLEAQVLERTRALDESQAALQRAARLEALGRLAGGVAHDFNNLLTGILGYAEMIEHASPDGDERKGDAREIRKSVERGARLTRQLLAFARKQPGHAQVLAPINLLVDLEGLLRQLLGPQIALRVTNQKSGGRVRMDPGQLEQVVVNMVVNARDAMPGGGAVDIVTADVDMAGGEAERIAGASGGAFVRLRVSDNGSGMTPEVLARIFEPFFTTKDESKGTGLGLPTCYGIVNQVGGFIDVHSTPGKGTTFDVYLPQTLEAEQWKPSAERVTRPSGGTETVLLAEDEAPVRELMAAALQAQGYTLLIAATGEEAIALAEKHQGPIDLLLTDMVMPGLSGLEAASRIAASRPSLRVLVVSGYMPEGVTEAGGGGPAFAHVAKPVSPTELSRRVRALLDEGLPQPGSQLMH